MKTIDMTSYFENNGDRIQEGRRTVIMPPLSLVCHSEEGLIRGMEDRGYMYLETRPGPWYVFRKMDP